MNSGAQNTRAVESAVERLLEVIASLRGKDGCPWDREQTLETLKPYLIEEAYEVLEAIDKHDPEAHREELGDLLLQIVLHAQIHSEQKHFAFTDVVTGLTQKLIRRHPHVFGEDKVRDSTEVLQNWEKIKAGEKAGGRRSLLEGVPRHLPSLQKAQRVQARAARVGFDWTEVRDVLAKVDEELGEVREAMAARDAAAIEEELGDLLFAVVNLGRFHDVNAEEALHRTTQKFTRRFQEIERRVHASGRSLGDCSLEEMDAIWDDVKREQAASGERS